ncbi:MAG: SDR family NAD(P)-dependent oxidoreductase [Rhodobacter sp.]|nr:SDR family NAD(P)-dependent oxidoreductase [Rhodobacter sp.]
MIADSFIPLHETLCAVAEDLEDELKAIAKERPLARRLMTVPGVGVMVSLGFIATVDHAERFSRTADVGALGARNESRRAEPAFHSGRHRDDIDPALARIAPRIPYPGTEMMRKTILITGATDGIGRPTARRLAEQGHKVLLHGRNAEKLKTAADEIGPDAETYLADLSHLEDVHSMAALVRERHTRLDVLINNAGILKSANTRTVSGRDIRFEVNTIAPYVLTRELLPIIPSSGRILNLSSAAQAPVDVTAMAGGRDLGDMEAYSQSKPAITIWSQALATELPDGPLVVSVDPGSLLATKMVKEGFGIAGNDIEIGADILIRAALSDEFVSMTGKHFDNDAGRFALPHPGAQQADHVAAVMAALNGIVGER